MPAAAPAQGSMSPTATLAISMAIEAGLKPICWAPGIKMLPKKEVAAAPEKKLVPKATR